MASGCKLICYFICTQVALSCSARISDVQVSARHALAWSVLLSNTQSWGAWDPRGSEAELPQKSVCLDTHFLSQRHKHPTMRWTGPMVFPQTKHAPALIYPRPTRYSCHQLGFNFAEINLVFVLVSFDCQIDTIQTYLESKSQLRVCLDQTRPWACVVVWKKMAPKAGGTIRRCGLIEGSVHCGGRP